MIHDISPLSLALMQSWLSNKDISNDFPMISLRCDIWNTCAQYSLGIFADGEREPNHSDYRWYWIRRMSLLRETIPVLQMLIKWNMLIQSINEWVYMYIDVSICKSHMISAKKWKFNSKNENSNSVWIVQCAFASSHTEESYVSSLSCHPCVTVSLPFSVFIIKSLFCRFFSSCISTVFMFLIISMAQMYSY